MEDNGTLHCQICARNIKAKKGVIAHHGYTRPGHGWQTSSCFGARYLPYEQSCDRIGHYIEFLENYIAGQEAAYARTKVADTITNPAYLNELAGRLRNGDGGYKKSYAVQFLTASYQGQLYSQVPNFERAKEKTLNSITQNIDNARSEIAHMQERRRAWYAAHV